MTSETQKNSGYPLPPVVETDTFVCLKMMIPDKPEYWAAVLGAITTLGQWWSWEKDYVNDSQGGRIAAEIWRKTIYETLVIGGDCMDCCDEIDLNLQTIINNQSINNITKVSETVNEFATIINDYDTNGGDITILYPDLAVVSDSGNVAHCLALKALVKMICDYRIATNRDQQALATIVSVGFAIGGAAVTLFSGGTFLALGLGLASTGAALGAALIQVADAILENTTAQNEVACAMLCKLDGAVMTQATFATLASGLGFPALSPEALIADVVAQFIVSEDVYATYMTSAEEQYNYAELGLASCNCEECPDPQKIVTFDTGGYAYSFFTNGGSLAVGGGNPDDHARSGLINTTQQTAIVIDFGELVTGINYDIRIAGSVAGDAANLIIQRHDTGAVLAQQNTVLATNDLWEDRSIALNAPYTGAIRVIVQSQNPIINRLDNISFY